MPVNMQDLYTKNPGTVSATGAGVGSAQASQIQTTPQAQAKGYTAKEGQVGQEQLASQRLTEITKQDSPLMQRARMEGMLTAGRRGLQNSSIAAGAAQGAMVDRAAPLATHEAATYSTQALANQEAVNRASEVSTGRETDVSVQNAAQAQESARLAAQLGTDVSKYNVGMAQERQLENVRSANRMREQTMLANADINKQYIASQFAMDSQMIQSQYAALIGANDAAARMFGSYYDSVSQMMANKDIAPDRAAAMMTASKNMLQSGLNLLDQMNQFDMSTNLPNFGTAAGPTGVTMTSTNQAPAATVQNAGIYPSQTQTVQAPSNPAVSAGYVADQPTGTIGNIYSQLGWTRYKDPATGKYYNYDASGNLTAGPY